MEKHGIGTDATHADHIETIKARQYAGVQADGRFLPCSLGMGLVQGYDAMGIALSKPNLRAELEADLKRFSQYENIIFICFIIVEFAGCVREKDFQTRFSESRLIDIAMCLCKPWNRYVSFHFYWPVNLILALNRDTYKNTR